MVEAVTFREQATKGFAWNYLYKFTEFGLMTLYTVLVVRHFGPTISAPYAIFTALCTTAAIFTAFAVDGVLLRYMQRIATNEPFEGKDIIDVEKFGLRAFLKTLFAFRIFTLFIVSTLVSLGFIFLPYIFPGAKESMGVVADFIPLLIVYLFAQSVVAFCTLSLIGLLETKTVFFSSLIARGSLSVLGLFAVYAGWLSIQSAVILYVGSAIVNAIGLMISLNKELERREPRGWKTLRFPFVSVLKSLKTFLMHPRKTRLFLATPVMMFGLTAWGSDILTNVLGKQPDILMMGAMLGEHSAQIGYYSSASIVLLVTEYVFLLGFGGTLASIFSKLAHDDEKETGGISYPRLARARKEVAGFQNVLLLPLCAFMMFFAPDVIHVVYGSKFDNAVPLIRIGLTALALTVGVFSGGMQITSLAAIGKPKLFFRTRLFWGVANITANFFLIRWYGALGAIIGTQFANAFACGTEGYFAGKIIGSSFDLRGTVRIIVIAACSALAAYGIVRAIGLHEAWLFNAAAGGLICALLTSLFYYVLKVPEAHAVWKRLQGLLRQTNFAFSSHE